MFITQDVFIKGLLFIIIYILWERMKQLSKLRDFPSPPSLPLIGHMLEGFNLKDILRKTVVWARKYKTYMLFCGLKPYLLIGDVKLTEFLLSSNKFIEKSADYKLMVNWLGDGLLVSGGEKWRKRRKVFTPAFHYNILEDYIHIFESKAVDLIKNLNEKVGLDSFDVQELLGLYTLDVICETAMGTSVNSQTNPDSVYAKSINVLCEIAFRKCIMPIYQIYPIYRFTNLYKKEVKAIGVVQGFSKSVIQNRKKILHNKVEEKQNDFSVRKKTNFLDILLQSTIDGKPLSDADILEEVEIFMFEGHDTTSTALSAVLYYLSINQEIQEKVIEELNGIFDVDKSKVLTQQDFHKMKYLEQVIKETLRLSPPVAYHARTINEDTIFNGKLLAKGLTVAICPYIVHRDPDVYTDPEKFDPERFNNENQIKRNPYAYIPFSAGPRNCIGQKFAMLELKSCLSKILKNFIVLPSKIPKYKPELISFITLKSMNGMQIRLEQREKTQNLVATE